MNYVFTLLGFLRKSWAACTTDHAPAWLTSLGLLVGFLPVLTTHAATLPANFAETRLATGLDPTGMEFAPDGRLFIAEKSGRVRIIKNGALLPTPFLMIASVNNDNERGLQSITFDPNFASNQYVYVYYTVATSPVHNRVSRFTANGDVVVAGSETVLIELDNLAAGNHNGGALFFNGGKLFITTGENAVASNSQTLNNLLGKVLRINPDGSIPTDNPFYGTATGKNRAIWALGLRNPFKAVVQPGTGRIFINDVGGGSYEEINEGSAGKNYGWPGIEGVRTNQTPPANYQDPVYAYNRSLGCSITGGTFYNPPASQFPASFVGRYFFADYCNGYLKTLDAANGNVIGNFATGINRPIDVKVGPDGTLYYLARGGLGGGSVEDNTSSNNGELWRVQYTGSNVPTISAQPVNQVAPVGGSVTFTVGASGTGLTYQWQRNGTDITGATAASYTLSPVAQADNSVSFRVVVSNSAGSVTSDGATLTVNGNQAPTARILTPSDGSLYRGGAVIQFTGTGTDPEDSNLPASAFSWRVTFYHAQHTHPGPTPTVAGDGRSGSFVIPTEGETAPDVWFRLFLTVTDSQGSASTVSVDVDPKLVTLNVATNPSGLQVTIDGQPQTAPYNRSFVSGTLLNLSATATQTQNGSTYTFTGWSPAVGSGGRITVPDANTTYTASFTTSGGGSGIQSGATYTITAKHSGKVIDVSGVSTADGAAVHQWTYVGGNNQKWIMNDLGNGHYSIKAVHSGKALDVRGSSTADGAIVQQSTYNGGDNQQFKLIDVGDGYYRIVAKHSQKSLDVFGGSVDNGGGLIQWPTHGNDNQKFRFTKLSQPTGREGTALTADGETGINLRIYPNPATQSVTVEGVGDGVVTIVDMLGTVRVRSVGKTDRLVDVSALATGSYIIRVNKGGKVSSRKLLIGR